MASIYDATRSLPEDVLDRVAGQIVAATHALPGTEFLELGIGTGRIALAVAATGYAYTGVDISQEMMSRLREKVGESQKGIRLVEADVTDLPLRDDSFDVILEVHVLHLVPDWKQAVMEARRVLRPKGYFVRGRDRSVRGGPIEEIGDQWAKFVREMRAEPGRRYGTWEAVEQELTDLGARTALYRVARWEREFTAGEALEQQRNRVFSSSWSVPDDVLEAAHERMIEWAEKRFGDLIQTMKCGWEFNLSVSRFPDSD